MWGLARNVRDAIQIHKQKYMVTMLRRLEMWVTNKFLKMVQLVFE